MTPWEVYVLLSDVDKAQVRLGFVLGLWQGEVQALLLVYVLSLCGVEWNGEAGQFTAGG